MYPSTLIQKPRIIGLIGLQSVYSIVIVESCLVITANNTALIVKDIHAFCFACNFLLSICFYAFLGSPKGGFAQ